MDYLWLLCVTPLPLLLFVDSTRSVQQLGCCVHFIIKVLLVLSFSLLFVAETHNTKSKL